MRLVKGAGSEKTGACWMSALHWYVRTDQDISWSDHPNCVSPVVTKLAIYLNDWCTDGEREKLIGPHLFMPLGTNTGPGDELKRAYLCADRACRPFAPLALERGGLKAQAALLRALRPVVDKQTAKVAARAAEQTRAARAAAELKRLLFELILDCCAIGTKKEVVPCCEKAELLTFLETR